MKDKLNTSSDFRVKEYNVVSDKVVFVFTAMGTRIPLYSLFIKKMNKKGYSCIIYDYPLSLIHQPSFNKWKNFFAAIVADAQSRLDERKSNGAKAFYAYGVSMGTLMAQKFAEETPDISHVVLNLPYGDLAKTIWTFRGTRKARLRLKAQGFDEATLRKNLEYIDPIVNASKLKQKRVLMHISKSDRVHIYTEERHTARAFEAAKLDLMYLENKYLGHFLGGAKNMLDTDTIDAFFTQKTPHNRGV